MNENNIDLEKYYILQKYKYIAYLYNNIEINIKNYFIIK